VRGLVLLSVVLLSLGPAEARGEGVIVALGDSLTAGLGVDADEAFPARLQVRLRREGYAYRVVNAGVSGDTTAGGLRRVDWVLRTNPEIVIVALGANDGLRGQSPQAVRANLEEIVARLQAAGARVLLAGMRLPPNYGAEFTKEFEAVFPAPITCGAISAPCSVGGNKGRDGFVSSGDGGVGSQQSLRFR